MKNYKLLYIYRQVTVLIALLLSIFLNVGCTKNFEERNTNKAGLIELSKQDMRSLFPGSQHSPVTGQGFHTNTMLFAGMYSQYFAGTNPGQESHRYVIVQRWMDIWPVTYINVSSRLVTIIEQTKGKEPAMNAIARIWKVWAFHRLTDYFGPIPYSKIGKDTTIVNYDSQKDIYFDFFKELDEATTDLKNNLGATSFGDKDLIFQGNNEKWFKFANTLRLRLAIRISNVEPAKAKIEAEKAYASGVLTNQNDGAFLSTSADFLNGLNHITAQNGTRMSAMMESLLKGYNDPRLDKFWRPAVSDGLYHGVRSGMSVGEQSMPVNSPNVLSNVSLKYDIVNRFTNPAPVMYVAEAYFLRAEGALNGWNMGGSAQELYEKGIKMSMNEHGITDDNIINIYINGTSLPMAPGGYFNTPALTDIPVKFSIVPERRREQIGTQKWLAMFPEPHEAWAEMRRSGYPKFYPIINSQNPDIGPDKMIRRISFLDREILANGPAVEAAVSLLGGGPDKVNTPLWWDKNP